jgi:hypothetical protein
MGLQTPKPQLALSGPDHVSLVILKQMTPLPTKGGTHAHHRKSFGTYQMDSWVYHLQRYLVLPIAKS